MKRLTILLAGLVLALPVVSAPSATADHLTYPRTFTVFDISQGRGAYGESYTGTAEGGGERGYTFWIKIDNSVIQSATIDQNKSWTSTGYNRMLYQCCGVNDWAHINRSFNPPCGDGDTGTVSIRYRLTNALGSITYYKIVDPVDC